MYNPNGAGLEFVELRNISGAPVPLFHPTATTNTWALTGGLAYTFPQGLVLPPDGHLVVSRDDPSLFRDTLGVEAGVPVFGPFTGALDDDFDSIKLRKPGDPEPDGSTPAILVDRVKYGDQAPWPVEADGTGASLQKISAALYGNDPAHWQPGFFPGGSPGADLFRAPRSWLRSFGWTQDYALHELTDHDLDGRPTWMEYMDGTHPQQQASLLLLHLKATQNGDLLELTWPSSSGRTYTLYWAQEPGGPMTPLAGAEALPGTGSDLSVQLPTSQAANRTFMLGIRVTPNQP
jgi:hypothetical protein